MKDALTEWTTLATRIRAAIRGLSDEELDRKVTSEGWSVREVVHHLVEANFVASGMILAALAPGESRLTGLLAGAERPGGGLWGRQ